MLGPFWNPLVRFYEGTPKSGDACVLDTLLPSRDFKLLFMQPLLADCRPEQEQYCPDAWPVAD